MGGHAGAVLTYYATAFDCINHDLLIVKLNTHGVDKLSLNLICFYPTGNKEQK